MSLLSWFYSALLLIGSALSWNWGNGQPSGTVEEVVEGDAKVTTNKGNEVTRKGGEFQSFQHFAERQLISLLSQTTRILPLSSRPTVE